MKTLKWHGGKDRLVKKLNEIAPPPPHTKYLESHAGGLSYLFAKSPEGVSEFANDLNTHLTNFWNVIRTPYLFESFRRLAEASPLSEVLFAECYEKHHSFSHQRKASPQLRAYWFFIVYRQSRQGVGNHYCTPTKRTRRGMNEQVSAWLTAVEGLPEAHARMKRVEIWNRDAIDAIMALDDKDLFVNADPPYLHATRSSISEYKEHEMTWKDHGVLLRHLAAMKGKFMLHGYPSSLYREFEKKYQWNRLEFEMTNSASSKKTKDAALECVWMNY